MDHVSCQFREHIGGDGVDEFATCGLLKLLTGVTDDRKCRVRRDACVACCAESFPAAVAVNSVITSLLYQISRQAVEEGGSCDFDLSRAEGLQDWTEQCISREPPGVHVSPSCDVVLVCRDSSPQTRRAIESVLNQDEATTVLHLVDDGGQGGEVIRQFEGRWNVLTHSISGQHSLAAACELIAKLRTEFIAFADARTTSRPDRIATAVQTLRQQGSDVFASALATPAVEFQPRQPAGDSDHCLLAATLVMRRTTLIDVAMLAHPSDDFSRRVATQGHLVSLDARALVVGDDSWGPDCDACNLTFAGQRAFDSCNGAVECDIVLPFHGHLEYVDQAIEGLINQEHADVVIHLVDDATPEDTSDLLRRWGSDRRVRAYRNERNLGQYTSFNNVYPYLETELVAVQDADDVSLPNRIHYSGNCLQASDAEIFSAACDLVVDGSGEPPRVKRNPLTSASHLLTNKTRYSHYPTPSYGCFLLNPTMMIRRELFGRLGGFADYRELLQNRGGLDTEFFQRAFWSGVRFFVSRQRLVKMRIHEASATQNVLTGFGSEARRASNKESRRRASVFRQGLFQARMFGGLGNYFGLTKRL